MKNDNAKAKAIISLHERGYKNEFILRNECLLSVQQCELLWPDQFEIIETYCFRGETSTNGNFIIYAIRSLNNDVAGILMTSYSALTIGMSIHLWSKLVAPIKQR